MSTEKPQPRINRRVMLWMCVGIGMMTIPPFIIMVFAAGFRQGWL